VLTWNEVTTQSVDKTVTYGQPSIRKSKKTVATITDRVKE